MSADSSLFYDPDKHPHDTLKSFKDFLHTFELRYDAQFPDVPRASMDAALQRWKATNGTAAEPDPVPSLDQYDEISDQWKSKDKVAKVIGMFSAARLASDWETVIPNEKLRKKSTWDEFKTAMCNFYAPTENPTLSNFHFRDLIQGPDECFTSYFNRVEREAKSCFFKCKHADCTAEDTAVRDQIVIGTCNNKIREEALLRSWDLKTLRTEGMRLESASRGESEIAGSSNSVNKLGKYSYANLKNKSQKREKTARTISCYNCGDDFTGPGFKHKQVCRARDVKCSNCGIIGHFSRKCDPTRGRDVKFTSSEEHSNGDDSGVFNLNIFRIRVGGKHSDFKPTQNDFKVQVISNGALTNVTADTGAKVSVCGYSEAQRWNLVNKMSPTTVQIKPYNSNPIPAKGVARCAVTFGETSIPVEWYILDGKCEPILSGAAAVELGIITFSKTPQLFQPLNRISTSIKKSDQEIIQNLLAENADVFSERLGKHNSYVVKLHVDSSIKPVVSPVNPTPYHLMDRIQKVLHTMIENDVIEEHPVGAPAPWVSRPRIVPKPDGSLRVTLDARSVNKAIQSSNLPIPRQEDIKAKLSGATVFSKLDFRSAFWQLELHPDSRYLTVFSVNNKLYRYKRLVMGIKSAQGELNAALMPLFRHIPKAHLIHDDLFIAAENIEVHNRTLKDVLKAVSGAGLTLNHDKCHFAMPEVTFWGMIFSKYGVRPDPAKVEALDSLDSPKNKEELISFLCMMQSNSEFIPSFAQKSAPLRYLTKDRVRFRWNREHQQCFENLLSAFKKDTLLRYFNMSKQTFIFTDAHITGLGAILAQGESVETAKPIAISSRTTTDSEKNYPQIDLEGLAVDFGLRRFRNYLVGAPSTVIVVTDHMPLCSVFNGNRTGSIRTERYKQRNQDIRYKVIYQKGKQNQTDFVSRRATPISHLGKDEQKEADDVNNLLYTLHTTPITDRITLKSIAEETSADPVLSKLQKLVKEGKSWIPRDAEEGLRRFRQIIPEITMTGNGILLKGERLILPDKLQPLAIQLAHQGSHPGQSSMERRLRFHFYFHNMNMKVQNYLEKCPECKLFADKKCKEPLKAHTVPGKCWEKVSVDLFGPMPSKKHIIVVQDLASRFPAAKIVTSTAANKVLPALAHIYDDYGNPGTQLSDNGPPFNSKAMDDFASQRHIQLQKIPPLHPSSNPVENFMRPLGKAMKISNFNKASENNTLQNLLQNYRDTPHPATGVPPAAMMFRDSMNGCFPRGTVNDHQVDSARSRDESLKQEKENQCNESKYKKASNLSLGDYVLIRNYRRQSKFDPVFLPDPYIVMGIMDYGRKVEVQRLLDFQQLIRHPDDIKKVDADYVRSYHPPSTMQMIGNNSRWNQCFTDYDDGGQQFFPQPVQLPQPPHTPPAAENMEPAVPGMQLPPNPLPHQGTVRQSDRQRHQVQRYGSQVYDENVPLPGEEDTVQPWWPGYPQGAWHEDA